MGFSNPIRSVEVSRLPNEPLFWPCQSGEDSPPIFAGSCAYAAFRGQTTVKLGTTGGSISAARWNALTRYGPEMQDTVTITALYHYTGAATGAPTRFGFWDGTPDGGGNVAEFAGATGHEVRLTNPAGGYHAGSVSLLPFINTWVLVTLVYSATGTTLTVDNDPALQLVGSVKTDAKLGSFEFSSGNSTTGVSPATYLSNLQAVYS